MPFFLTFPSVYVALLPPAFFPLQLFALILPPVLAGVLLQALLVLIHPTLSELMKFVDLEEYPLGRLEAEVRQEAKKQK